MAPRSGLEPTEMTLDRLPLPFLHLRVTAPHKPVFKAYFATESEDVAPVERKNGAFGGDQSARKEPTLIRLTGWDTRRRQTDLCEAVYVVSACILSVNNDEVDPYSEEVAHYGLAFAPVPGPDVLIILMVWDGKQKNRKNFYAPIHEDSGEPLPYTDGVVTNKFFRSAVIAPARPSM